MINNDDDDDLSGFLLGLASSLGGSWVLDFHYSIAPVGNPLPASISHGMQENQAVQFYSP